MAVLVITSEANGRDVPPDLSRCPFTGFRQGTVVVTGNP